MRFLALNCDSSRLKAYLAARKSRADLKARFRRRPLRIVIGAAGIFDEGWIGTEAEQLNLLVRKDWKFYFKDNPIDAILAEHVWEHLTIDDGISAARQCHDFLRPGGYLRVAVPDGFRPDPEYIDYVKPGGTGAGADDHKVLYDHRTFSRVFEQAGFQVHPLEYFDAEGRFHFTEWDSKDGTIRRSKRYDPRNQDGAIRYTSLIVDARKAA